MLCNIGWDYAMCIFARVSWKRMVLLKVVVVRVWW